MSKLQDSEENIKTILLWIKFYKRIKEEEHKSLEKHIAYMLFIFKAWEYGDYKQSFFSLSQ